MSRNIIREKDVSGFHSGNNESADNYVQKAIKLIPAEIITFYTIVTPFIFDEGAPILFLQIAAFSIGVIATPIFLYFMYNIKEKLFLSLSTISFIGWTISIGGLFEFIPHYDKIGLFILAVIVLLSPLAFYKK